MSCPRGSSVIMTNDGTTQLSGQRVRCRRSRSRRPSTLLEREPASTPTLR